MFARRSTIQVATMWIVSGLVTMAAAGEPSAAVRTGQRMVIHEWGTFTMLQDEQGRELTGINVDDEPVPEFVHNLSPFLLASPVLTSENWRYRMKAAPRRHPQVTMRLETPVIYFYPPEGAQLPQTLDVAVEFRGGWLTEFYPQATASAPGLKDDYFDFGELTPQSVGTLSWEGLQVGTDGQGPKTDEQVWLAPRQVSSVPVTAAGGESERYLFYRGVGNLRAPLRVTTDLKQNTLSVYGNFDEVLSCKTTAEIPRLWLTHIRGDGTSAFRPLDGIRVRNTTDEVLLTTAGKFREDEFSKGNLGELKKAMRRQLVAEGLFDDEATALLATWDRAYFRSPGLRLFFLVPRVWTDRYLPLSIRQQGQNLDADVQRVMVGRIELIDDGQRESLKRLAGAEASDGSWIERIPESPARDALLAGRADFGDLGVKIPADYQSYLGLGRFRNALVVHEERLRPDETLTRFINTYGLHPYRAASTLRETAAQAAGGEE